MSLSANINESQWRPVLGHEGYYEISDRGELRNSTGRLLKPFVRKNGYAAFFTTTSGKPKCLLVHAMVLEAFVSPRPAGMQVRHLDGNPRNNTLANLAWGSAKQNAEDKRAHGRIRFGAQNPKTKLTAEQVIEIRSMTGPVAAIAREFGVCHATIKAIKQGRTWQHV